MPLRVSNLRLPLDEPEIGLADQLARIMEARPRPSATADSPQEPGYTRQTGSALRLLGRGYLGGRAGARSAAGQSTAGFLPFAGLIRGRCIELYQETPLTLPAPGSAPWIIDRL